MISKAHGLLDYFVTGMKSVRTGKDANIFPGKTAVNILSLLEKKRQSHVAIERLYQDRVRNENRSTKLHQCIFSDDVEGGRACIT